MTSDYNVIVAHASRLDEVGPLFKGMVEHHRLVTGDQWPVGTMLMDAGRELLRARGAGYWAVGVVEVNIDAVRLYEREGFEPFYRQLLGPI